MVVRDRASNAGSDRGPAMAPAQPHLAVPGSIALALQLLFVPAMTLRWRRAPQGVSRNPNMASRPVVAAAEGQRAQEGNQRQSHRGRRVSRLRAEPKRRGSAPRAMAHDDTASRQDASRPMRPIARARAPTGESGILIQVAA